MKISLDKYYTEESLAKRLIEKTYEIIGRENITEIIEPSAGSGNFSRNIENCIAYDIEPESPEIIKQDFLELELEYFKGRMFIGNPPFGSKNNLARKFYYKSCILGDYVAFIMPISQLNNTNSLFLFDLIYSEDLGKVKYSDRNLHCCFNIYRRPSNGLLNKKKQYNLKDLNLIEIRKNKSKISIPSKYDLTICSWGAGSIGKIAIENQYAKQIYIQIFNDDLKEVVLNELRNLDYKKEFNFVAVPNLPCSLLYEYLLKSIPELK